MAIGENKTRTNITFPKELKSKLEELAQKDGQYTISELIELLESAQEKFGDKKILIHDMNSNTIGGFSHIYLHHGFDEREKYGEDYYEDDSICIYG